MNGKLYEEVGTTYRFFLGWRHAAFAGNLVVIYGALSLTLTALEKQPTVAWIVPLIAAPIGVLLWILDVRTRDLYRAAIRAGKQLETKQPEPALFTQLGDEAIPRWKSLSQEPFLKRVFKKLCSHSAALNVFFIGSSFVFVVLALWLRTAPT